MPEGMDATLYHAREVPLGGLRGMQVHRTLPQRGLPMIGAWCFLDRFGPQQALMRVQPHPHTGLQTVTWPSVGEVRHRDSLGSDVVVSPGALNLMTSGHGIAHSEYSVGEDAIELTALQFWVALPEDRRHGPAAFEQHSQLPVVPLARRASVTVILGEFDGVASPATVHTPIVGAEIHLKAGARARIPLRPEWEHALVGVTGDARVHTALVGLSRAAEEPTLLQGLDLLALGEGRDFVDVEAADDAVLFLLGGEPFAEDLLMWWNFVGRSHEEIVAARDAWEAGDPRFGHVPTHGSERVPAPPLPKVRLTPRHRRR